MDLLTLLVAVGAFCFAAWLINKFATDPYRYYGLIALAIFALIFVCERFGVFRMLQSIAI